MNEQSYKHNIEELKKQNVELYGVCHTLLHIINKNINEIELNDEESVFIDYYMNKIEAIYVLKKKKGEQDEQ